MSTDGPYDAPRSGGYPVLLDLVGQRCLVVGAGPVGARRAGGLLGAGARVTMVAPEISAKATTLGPDANLVIERRTYRVGEVAGYRLAITATGQPDVDATVVADADAAGVLVASADQATPGTVRLPAVLRDGPVVVAVSTGASSPALARWLRDRLARSVPVDVGTVATLVAETRRELQGAGQPTEALRWGEVLDQVVPLVEAGRIDEARATLARLADRA